MGDYIENKVKYILVNFGCCGLVYVTLIINSKHKELNGFQPQVKGALIVETPFYNYLESS